MSRLIKTMMMVFHYFDILVLFDSHFHTVYAMIAITKYEFDEYENL